MRVCMCRFRFISIACKTDAKKRREERNVPIGESMNGTDAQSQMTVAACAPIQTILTLIFRSYSMVWGKTGRVQCQGVFRLGRQNGRYSQRTVICINFYIKKKNGLDFINAQHFCFLMDLKCI